MAFLICIHGILWVTVLMTAVILIRVLVHPWFIILILILLISSFFFLLKYRVVVTYESYPQRTVDNNIGPDRFEGSKALDLNYCRQPTLWLHDLCLEVLTVHGIELHLLRAKAVPPTHTINVALLTLQQWVQLLTSLAMTRFGPRIVPITFPMPGGCATGYATDAGYGCYMKGILLVLIFNIAKKFSIIYPGS